jgi:hypothetical protein
MNRRNMSETPLEMEERHIVQFERMISKQELRLSEMERAGYAEAAERARDRLASMQATLQLAWKRRDHLLRLWV